jgi:hypothetical protein
MTDQVTSVAQKIRKPSAFPIRLTVCIAPDQAESLAEAKKMFRATESFIVRTALDQFCRANQIFPSINGNGGNTNGR